VPGASLTGGCLCGGVRFELSEEGGSTKIVFDQAGFPEEAGPHLESGWAKMYWEPLKAYLE